MYYLQSFFDGRKPEYEGVVHLKETIDLCPEFFIDEMRAGIAILGCSDFISYKEVDLFDAFVFFPLFHLLETYIIPDPIGGRKAAEEMIHMICEIRTDDDSFPKNEVGLLKGILKQCG